MLAAAAMLIAQEADRDPALVAMVCRARRLARRVMTGSQMRAATATAIARDRVPAILAPAVMASFAAKRGKRATTVMLMLVGPAMKPARRLELVPLAGTARSVLRVKHVMMAVLTTAGLATQAAPVSAPGLSAVTAIGARKLRGVMMVTTQIHATAAS